jgi:hypothetical protein
MIPMAKALVSWEEDTGAAAVGLLPRTCEGTPDEGGDPAPTSNRICIHQHSSAFICAICGLYSTHPAPAKGLPTKEGTRAHEQPHLHSSAFICVICG